MTRSYTRRIFFSAWLLFWLLLVAVSVQDYWRNGGAAVWQPVLWETSSSLVAGCLLLWQRRRTRCHDDWLASPKRWFALQLLWLPFNCALFVPLTFGLRHVVYALVGQTYHHQAWPGLFVYEAVKVSLLFAIFSVVLFGFLSYKQLLQEKERAQQANLLLQQAQLQQLTQQMQPHFLFNALNTISSLIYSGPDQADATLIQLADVLRATLDLNGQQEVDLATELRLLRAYAALMSARFVDRVGIRWEIDESVLACRVPVMSLQPLLENIFKHTVEQTRQTTQITVRVARKAAPEDSAVPGQPQLCLQLRDDQGQLRAEEGMGIGLKNLRQRLLVLYGAAGRLSLTQLAPAGVCAELILPWRDDAHPDR